MPLRDLFRPPLCNFCPWDGFHGGWPAMIVIELNQQLPPEFVAWPLILANPAIMIDDEQPNNYEYEVQIREARGSRRLVAVVEIVSPANKDHPRHRRAFVTKCEALLRSRVSVAIIDVVTDRHANLYADLLDILGQTPAGDVGSLSATVCRFREREEGLRFETWENTLVVGDPLPTLPLWLTDDFAVPLDLERTYEATCQALRIV